MNIKLLKIPSLIFAVGALTIASMCAFNRPSSMNSIVETQADEKAAKPLFVVIVYRPWAMVIGAETPAFALYEDGTVIYWRKEASGGKSVSAKLTNSEADVAALNRAWQRGKYVSAKLTDSEMSQILEKVNPQAFTSLENRYELAGGDSDAKRTLMVLREKNGTYKGVYVYGSTGLGDGDSYPKGVPKPLVDISRFVITYDTAKAKEWLPDYVEVMIWPDHNEYAPDKDLVWPRDWPDLSDHRTVRRGDGYLIYLGKARFEELRSFLANRRGGQAVRIGGKKWDVDARLPFPNEQIWQDIKSKFEHASH